MTALVALAGTAALLAVSCLTAARRSYPAARLVALAGLAVGPAAVAAVVVGLQPTQALLSDVETTVVQSVHE